VRLLVYDADSLEPLTWIDAAGNAAGIEPKIGDWEIGEWRLEIGRLTLVQSPISSLQSLLQKLCTQ
ncbi:MAG: hypothetical protein KDE24_27600, partial [Caldilinea sp.]|nr:hypothetical protein [Caldilinea sp.]